MLNYIATGKTAKLIQKICKNQNILILYEIEDITNIVKYLKETKVNFNLIKYFIIDVTCLDNSEDEIIESIYTFSRLYIKTRIIILAQGFDAQSNLLNKLYDKEIYNIIDSSDELQIEEQLLNALSDTGIQKKEVKRFEKIKEVKVKTSKLEKVKQNSFIHQSRGVYFYALLLETVTRFVKLICYIAIFLLTSIGITILLNPQLRIMVFQILSLK